MRLSTFLFASFLASGCGCDGEKSTRRRVSKIVGRDGGSLASRDGGLTVTVPPGALDHDVRLWIEPSDVEGPEGLLGSVYEVGPPGTEFDEPVTLAFRYEADELGGASAQGVHSGQYVDEVWICLPMNAAHTGAETVVTVTTHLSIYAIHLASCDAGCEGSDRCVDDAICGLACGDASDCPFPLDCLDGVCNGRPCEGGAGCDLAGTVCADPEARSLCLPSCPGGAGGVGSACGDPPEQMECTFGGKCVFEEECPEASEEIDCDPLGRVCWHQWCIAPRGGDTDVDTDSDTDADTDADTDSDTDGDFEVSHCERSCATDDDCCPYEVYPGCSQMANSNWSCFARRCRFLGCLGDAECAFMGVGAGCFQQAGGFLYASCGLPCDGPEDCAYYEQCLDAVDGRQFCGYDYGGCDGGGLDCDPALRCDAGDCVCDDDTMCEDAVGVEDVCVHDTCDGVAAGGGRAGEACSAHAECDSGTCCRYVPQDCPDLADLCTCAP